MERKLISISALLFFLFLGLFLINEFGEKKEAQTNSSTEISVPAIVSIKDLPKENISNSSNNESTKTSFLLESNASRVTKINESFEPKNATVPKKEEKTEEELQKERLQKQEEKKEQKRLSIQNQYLKLLAKVNKGTSVKETETIIEIAGSNCEEKMMSYYQCYYEKIIDNNFKVHFIGVYRDGGFEYYTEFAVGTV